MNKHLTILAAAALIALISFSSAVSLAEEEDATDFSWGKVKNISGNQIVITEYDYDSGGDIDVVYNLDPNVIFYNASSLKDITAGSEVWVDYALKSGKKIVMVMELSQPSYQDPGLESEEEDLGYAQDEAEY